MQKNDIFTVKIEDMTNLGFGVAKLEGKVVFVRGAVTGDLARVKLIKLQSSYMIGKLVELVEKSPLRLPEGEARCTICACSGCAYKLIGYDEELKIKEDSVRAVFKKAGLGHIKIQQIVPSPSVLHYRNKAQYPISKDSAGNYLIGFYKPKTHAVCEAACCPLAPEIFSDILETLRAFFNDHSLSVYDEKSRKGLLRHVYLRRGEISGEILLTLVITEDSLPFSEELCERISSRFPSIKGILLNKNDRDTNVILGEKYTCIFGRDYIEDTLSGVKLKLTAQSFYQVNHDAAELLYKKAKELTLPSKNTMLLDLYCGVGSIGLSMADEVGSLIGIEIVDSAIDCAKYNAEQNGFMNTAFFTGNATDCEKLLSKAESELGEKIRPDVILLDPPRSGCDEKLLNYISTLGAQRIVYISCNPSTLARDVVILSGHRYTAGSVTPFDLFPGTGHVETVVLLSREKADDYVRFSVHTKDLKTSMN